MKRGTADKPGRPLDGVRVLALEQFQALPYATRLLSDLGADVVKVEIPGEGDAARASQPGALGRDGRHMGATFIRNNAGKRSLAVDWRSEAGRDLLLKLLPGFDIFAENFRPGKLASLGLGFDDLIKVHPGLVYASISGFGQDQVSPYYSWGAYAPVAEAMAGFYQTQINRGEPPRPNFAGPLGDTIPALYAAIGLLAALREAERTRSGRHVDVAMFDAMIAVRDYSLANWSLGQADELVGFVKPFRASDGWCVVAIIRAYQFRRLAELIGREDWLLDQALADPRSWADRAQDLIIPAIEAWAADETRATAASKMAGVGVAVAPCLDNPDLVHDPHVKTRSAILAVHTSSDDETCYVPASPIKVSGMDPREASELPALGQDTRDILSSELGLSEGEIAKLLLQGVVGCADDRTP